MRTLFSVALISALFLAPTPAEARPTGDDGCAAVKQKASGRFLTCMMKTDAKFSMNGERGQRYRRKIRCRNNLERFFDRAESRFGGACITRADAEEVIADLELITDDTTEWLKTNEGDGPVEPRIFCGAGTTLDHGSNTCLWDGLVAPDACGNGTVENDEQCDFGDMGAASCESLGLGIGDLRCSAGCQYDTSGCFDPEVPAARFEVNGDGTVTDNLLGLMWEAKYDPRTIQHRDMLFLQHNLDRIFLFQINRDGRCWAGYCDWRLPTAEELAALGGGVRRCSLNGIPTELCREGETLMYWSASTLGSTGEQMVVGVPTGTTTLGGADSLYRAIAVRDLD